MINDYQNIGNEMSVTKQRGYEITIYSL